MVTTELAQRSFIPRHWLPRPITSLLAGLGLSLMSAMVTALPIKDPSLFDRPEVVTAADNELAAVLALVEAKDYEQAETAIRDILRRRPQSAPAHEILGTALALQGKLPEAVLSLEKAVEFSPQQASALTKLGDIALAIGQDAMAQDYFLKALSTNKQDRRAHQRLGELYERQGNLDKAVRHYQLGIVGTDPRYLGVKLNLAQIHVQRSEYQAARDLLTPFLHQDEVSSMVLRALAAAEAGSGQLPQALEYLTRATADADAASAALFTELGDVQLALGDDEAAATSYRTAIKLAEDPVVALLRLGELQATMGNYDSAEQTFKEAVATNPQAVQAYHGLGSLYGLTRRHDQALDAFQQGLVIEPQSSPLLRGVVVALIRLERLDEAEPYARQLAALSRQVQDHFLLGSLLEQEGKISEAEKVYRQTLTLDGNFWPALNNLATLLLHRDEVDQSLALARKAYELSGEQPVQPAHTYGWALLKHGDHKQAITILEQARHREPSHVLTRYHLGIAYQKGGEVSAAKAELTAALKLDKEFEFVEEAQRRLRSLHALQPELGQN